MQSLEERVEKEKGLPGAVLFVAISLAIFSNRKEHLIGVKNVENVMCCPLLQNLPHRKEFQKTWTII